MQVALVEQDEVSKKNTARRIEMETSLSQGVKRKTKPVNQEVFEKETSLSTTNKATPGVEAKFDHKHYNDFM